MLDVCLPKRSSYFLSVYYYYRKLSLIRAQTTTWDDVNEASLLDEVNPGKLLADPWYLMLCETCHAIVGK